jgi:hypothetical protein
MMDDQPEVRKSRSKQETKHTHQGCWKLHHITAIVKMVKPARNQYDTAAIMGNHATIAQWSGNCYVCSNCGLCASCNVVCIGLTFVLKIEKVGN